jgi:spore coat protein CotH
VGSTPAQPAASDQASSAASHADGVDPDYDIVFPEGSVNALTITIDPADWEAMQADLEKRFITLAWMRDAVLEDGADLSVAERRALLPKILAERAEAGQAAPSTTPEQIAEQAELLSGNPVWVPATISFQGQEWKHVGIRYKGVTSLQDPWLVGDLRRPFKFDFDEFEDDFPEINDQRFFGFKELSLANNYQDPTGMRDALVYSTLRDAGLPAQRTAPYEITLDHGEGPVRLGLYTAVEVVDDTGVVSYFGSDDGNIYEAVGPGASLSADAADQIEASFEKKNNEDEADCSDIEALHAVLHDPKRTTDPAAWRASLEASFDVDGFLEWLGIAAGVGHGDTYGFASHNFYLYDDPATRRLTWISWDHNLTFRDDPARATTLDKADVTDAWPLIRFLLDDQVYRQRYVELLAENAGSVLAADTIAAKAEALAAATSPVATKDMSADEYDAAVAEVVDYARTRAQEVAGFLGSQE